jgi:hypothetical protein
MKRLLIALLFVFVAGLITSDTASAQNRGPYGFMPFGFYQPYGATYSTSIRTPPYFSTNPPVYYGARHARPYGISPFASPPLVHSGENYKSRLRTQFSQPRVPTPESVPLPPTQAPQAQAQFNPCVSHSSVIKPANADPQGGVRFIPFVKCAGDQLVQINPFVEDAEDWLVKK